MICGGGDGTILIPLSVYIYLSSCVICDCAFQHRDIKEPEAVGLLDMKPDKNNENVFGQLYFLKNHFKENVNGHFNQRVTCNENASPV